MIAQLNHISSTITTTKKQDKSLSVAQGAMPQIVQKFFLEDLSIKKQSLSVKFNSNQEQSYLIYFTTNNIYIKRKKQQMTKP